ncbi:hypothetical protein HDU93_008888 [Gonapodya sp. JEL0774]|nr:hypothetical protein HDU93_008888 [Gonapodya sp. JEL0774]
MPRLFLTCGPAASGKSTHARQLESEQGFLRLSIDLELWNLGYRTFPTPDDVRERIKLSHRTMAYEALSVGRDVVVEHAFFRRADRDAFREVGRRAGAKVTVVAFRVAPEELARRLEARRGEHADDAKVDRATLERFLAGFEWPGEDEADVEWMRWDSRASVRLVGSNALGGSSEESMGRARLWLSSTEIPLRPPDFAPTPLL